MQGETQSTSFNSQNSPGTFPGRYTKPDPLGLETGVNLFLYAESNPLAFLDLLGLDSVQVCCRPILSGSRFVRVVNSILSFFSRQPTGGNHCFVRRADDDGNTVNTWSLVKDDGIALPDVDHPSDRFYTPQNGECGDPICYSDDFGRCLGARTRSYPIAKYPARGGVGITTGTTSSTSAPNSNSFAQFISRSCGVNEPTFVSEANTPGWFYWPLSGRRP